MKKAILQINSDIQEANTAVYDVELLVSEDGGKTWAPATLENFPAGGLDNHIALSEGNGCQLPLYGGAYVHYQWPRI